MIKNNQLVGYIYCAISPSGKKYYGKTITTIENRKNFHREYSLDRKNIFCCAIRKYGFNNFLWKQIEERFVNLSNNLRQDKIELNKILSEREKYWIKKDQTHLRKYGYNSTIGGEGVIGYVYTEDQKKKRSENSIGDKNGMYGKSTYDVWLDKYGKEEANIRKLNQHIKIIARITGEGNPMYGKNHLEKSKQKMRKAKLGTKASDESKNAMSISQNKRFTKQEERNKSSQKGEKNGMFGKCAYDIWLEKYGKEEANIRREKANLKRKQFWHDRITK
jgi:hypothetical protein